MVSADRDALLCDLAETYGVFDFKALPVSTLATLSVGLRDDSRIKIRMSGNRISRTEMLLAACLDRLSMLWWSKTEDGQKNRNRPKSILDLLNGTKQESDIQTFDSPESFDQAWASITGVKHYE